MLETPGGRAALVPAAGFCSRRDSDQKMYSPTKVITDSPRTQIILTRVRDGGAVSCDC